MPGTILASALSNLKGDRGVPWGSPTKVTLTYGYSTRSRLAPCHRRLPLCLLESSWLRAQALLCGVLLARADHTLTAASRVLGLAANRVSRTTIGCSIGHGGQPAKPPRRCLSFLVVALAPAGSVKSRLGRNHRAHSAKVARLPALGCIHFTNRQPAT
jgi:hypothetical protein